MQQNVVGKCIALQSAYLGSVPASAIATCIEYFVLTRKIKFDSDNIQMFVKPVLAVGIMGVVTYFFHMWFATYIKSGSIATIISILVAVVVYLLSILWLKILDREDYHMLPYGDKIYAFMQKIKLVK